MAVLQLRLSVDIAAQKTLGRIGPGSAIQNVDARAPSRFGPRRRQDLRGRWLLRCARASAEGRERRIRQMGADRVELDAVETSVSRTVPWHH